MLRFLSILILSLLPTLAPAQTGGSADASPGGEPAHSVTCAPGDRACIARLDQLCRAEGGHVTGRSQPGGALVLSCAPGAPVGPALTPGQETRSICTIATPICTCSGSLGGGGGVYQCLIDMMMMCLASGGQFQLHGILADGPDSGTVYGGCLPRR